ncbi:hypothetical protein L6164_023809 [Bauhinia variegata]|uniref:Uncharacterized protein n=1 Tax=Bauhinia variegata TaxID=167791 RepID=A0ACB9MK76_BAUVA|nr:hypothetical protein L6164_023809 [Bauhinia variegata]
MSEEDSREKIHKMMENIYTPCITEYIASEYPALLTKTNIKGDTSLHIAVRGNQSGIIKTIVHNYTKQSGDKKLLEIQNALGTTALHEAVIINGHLLNTEDALFLLDGHPEVAHCLNNGNKSPLYLAVQNGSRKLVEAMLKKAMLPGKGKSLPDCTGVSPIHAAILESRRTSRTVDLHITIRYAGTDSASWRIYLRDEEGNTPLHCAASNGDFSAVVELLKYSGSVTLDSGNTSELGIYKFGRITLERNNNGQLPVHIACHRGHVEIVNLLLKWWPGPEKMLNKQGQSILHVAAESGKENVVNYILSDARLKDSLVAETDNNGNTPLHLAAKGLHARILFSLTRHHRKTNYVKLRNNEGYTARDFVSVNDSGPMLRKIVSTVILYSAGASHSRKGKIGRRPPKEAPSVDLIKSRMETLMLIAILVAGALMVQMNRIQRKEARQLWSTEECFRLSQFATP